MPLNQEKQYTYKDYLTWPENERWEIINGTPYMQAAPTWEHQAISRELLTQFNNYLKNKPCQVFAAPFDLRLPNVNKFNTHNTDEFDIDENGENSNNVFQPDIVVVCDKSRLRGTGYYGTPKLVIEITSNATIRNDKIYKFNKYEMAGVEEYWIVEPVGKMVTVFTLQDNKRYGRPEAYTETETIKVMVFPEMEIDLEPVFAHI